MSYSINDLIYINKDTGDTYFTGNILPIGSNQYSLGTSNLSWKDLNLSGNLNLQGGSLNIQNSTFSGDLLPSSSNTYNIGSSNLRWKDLYLSGNIYSQSVTTSNLVVLNAYSTDYQISPIRQVYYITSTPRSTFTLTTDGYFGGNACNVHIFVDNKKLTYYSDSLNNYQLAVSYDHINDKTDYNVTLTTAAVFGNLVDITIWPQILKESIPNPLRLYQYVNIEYSAPITRPYQLPPIRQVFYVNSATQSIFDITTAGVYGGTANNVQVFVGQSLLSYYNSSATDYTLNVTYIGADTVYTITLTNPVQYASVVDITIWPTIISGSTLVGSIYQTINTGNSQWQTSSGSDIYYYTSGNVGIGTNNPNMGKLVVGGSIVPSANSIYNLGTPDLRWKDLYISGSTIDLGGTKISRDDQSGGLMIKSGAGILVDNTVNTLYASNVIINGGNIGIGTTIPIHSLHVGRQSYFNGNVGIGTTAPRQLLDVQGGNAIVSGNIGIGTTIPTQKLHIEGNAYISGNISAGNLGMFRNRIINGDMRFNQRGTSTNLASMTGVGTTYGYVADRWGVYRGGYATGAQMGQGTNLSTTDLPFIDTGTKTYARVSRISGNTGTADIVIAYGLESQDSQAFVNKYVTLSFYCRAGANFSGTSLTSLIITGTGTDEGYQRGANVTGIATYTQTNNISTNWSYVTQTALLGTNINQVGVYISYTPTGTAGANDYFDITCIQLEKGTIATPFEFRPYGIELQLCHRYCQVLGNGIIGRWTGPLTFQCGIIFRSPLRANPSYTSNSSSCLAYRVGIAPATLSGGISIVINSAVFDSTTGSVVDITGTQSSSSATAGEFSLLRQDVIIASAEL